MPVLPTCPVANCPPPSPSDSGRTYGGPVLSQQWIHGESSPARQPQFMSNIGLYIKDDGTFRGQYVTQYLGAMQGPSAGPSWALNTDIVRGACAGGRNSLFGQPGSGIPFGAPGCQTPPGSLNGRSTIGYELDLSNFDADALRSNSFVAGLYIQTLSSHTSTAGVSFGKTLGSATSWHRGIEFSPGTIADAAIYDVSDSPFTIYTTGTHSQATVEDGSTGPAGIIFTGAKTRFDLQSDTTSPIGVSIINSHALASLYDNSTGPTAIRIDGSHSTSSVDLSGKSPIGIVARGAYSLAAISTSSSKADVALDVAAGQQICLAGRNNGCLFYDAASHKVVYSFEGKKLFSVDSDGNAVFKGTVTGGGTP